MGGIFAGVGIPKLRKTGGGIDTGAERDSSHTSDPETSRKTPLKPPTSSAPKPPTAPRLNALRPTPHTTESSPPQPSAAANPLVVNLRKPPPKPASRPNSENYLRSHSDLPPRAPPPPPNTAKPPPPPITLRKSSTPVPSIPKSNAPPPPAPPLSQPQNTAPPLPHCVPTHPSVPLPLPSSAPKALPIRSTPPPPAHPASSISDIVSQSIATQAARNAHGNGSNSPAAPPPPPPPVSSPLKQSTPVSSPSAPSLPPPSRATPQQTVIPALDPSLYTLSNGNSLHHISPSTDSISPSRNEIYHVEDLRWRFQPDSELPKPREFIGGIKKYRAGRGSSVPLDLSRFR